MPDFDAFTGALATSTHSAMIYAERDGRIAFWNRGAEMLFGRPAPQALGERLDLIVPEAYRAMHWTGFDRTIGSAWQGSAGWGPVPGLHRDGAIIDLEAFLIPIHGEDGRVKGVLANFRPAPSSS